MQKYALTDSGPSAPGQLYNLETDPGERKNLYSQHPDVVKKLKKQLERLKKADVVLRYINKHLKKTNNSLRLSSIIHNNRLQQTADAAGELDVSQRSPYEILHPHKDRA